MHSDWYTAGQGNCKYPLSGGTSVGQGTGEQKGALPDHRPLDWQVCRAELPINSNPISHE